MIVGIIRSDVEIACIAHTTKQAGTTFWPMLTIGRVVSVEVGQKCSNLEKKKKKKECKVHGDGLNTAVIRCGSPACWNLLSSRLEGAMGRMDSGAVFNRGSRY